MSEIINEIWKSIAAYEGLYEVSNFGRVRGLNRVCRGKKWRKKLMILDNHYAGYKVIKFSKDGEKRKKFFVHRLVAEAFIPNLENKTVVNHIDADKSNNHISNLEWMTYKENTNYYYHVTKKAKDISKSNVENASSELVDHALANF